MDTKEILKSWEYCAFCGTQNCRDERCTLEKYKFYHKDTDIRDIPEFDYDEIIEDDRLLQLLELILLGRSENGIDI